MRRLALVFLGLGLTGCALFERPYSSYNNGPQGYGAFYALLEKLDVQPQRWQKKYADLAKEPAGAVLIRVKEEVPLDDELIQWVRSGNVLIELEAKVPEAPQDKAVEVPRSLGIHIPQSIEVTKLARREAVFKERLIAVTTGPQEAIESSIVLGTNSDPLLVIQPLEEGAYMYGSIPDLAINRRLDQDSNYQFLVNLALIYRLNDAAPIYLDEVIHGYGPSTQEPQEGLSWWDYFAASPFILMAVQGLFLTLVYLVGKNQPLGLPQPAPETLRTNNAEYIDALAATYERAGAGRMVFGLLVDQFRQNLGQRMGIPRPADEQLIAQSTDPVQLQGLLEEAKQATPLSNSELLARVDRLHRLSREVNS